MRRPRKGPNVVASCSSGDSASNRRDSDGAVLNDVVPIMASSSPAPYPSAPRWAASSYVQLSHDGKKVTYTGRSRDFKPLLGKSSTILFGDAVTVFATVPCFEGTLRATPDLSCKQFYFEVHVHALLLGGSVAIGYQRIASADDAPKEIVVGSMPGWTKESLAWHSDGEVFVSKANTMGSFVYGEGDTVGCGFRHNSGDKIPVIFFTLNGRYVFEVDGTGFDLEDQARCVPVVGMDTAGAVLVGKFEKDEFLWEGQTTRTTSVSDTPSRDGRASPTSSAMRRTPPNPRTSEGLPALNRIRRQSYEESDAAQLTRSATRGQPARTSSAPRSYRSIQKLQRRLLHAWRPRHRRKERRERYHRRGQRLFQRQLSRLPQS